MDDWLAAGISYGVFLLLAESDNMAELAGAMAWGLAVVVFVRNLGALQQKAPGIFSAPASAPASRDIAPVAPGAPQGV